MNLKLEIRRNSDGVIATDIWPDWEYNTYWWEDGNASCDCNRELFFLRAIGEDEPIDTECGDDRFSVRLFDADTGLVLYDELTPNDQHQLTDVFSVQLHVLVMFACVEIYKKGL